MAYDMDNAVIGLGSQILVAPKTTAGPEDVTTPWGAAFKDVGAVSEKGLTLTPNLTSVKKKIWHSKSTAKVLITGQELAAKFECVEWNAVTFPLMYGGGAWAGTAGSFRFDISSQPAAPEQVFGFEWLVDTYTFRLVLDRASVSGVGDATLVNDDWTPVELTVEALDNAGILGYYITDFPGVDPAA